MLRTRPVRTRFQGTTGAFAPEQSDALHEHDGFASREARSYAGECASWSSSLPLDVLQELLKQQMAVAHRPPTERARVLMESRVWDHLRENEDALFVVQDIVALELHELQSMWTGLGG
jgi:hypothetical protein